LRFPARHVSAKIRPPHKRVKSQAAVVEKASRLLGSSATNSAIPDQSIQGFPDIRNLVAAFLLWIGFAHDASATGAEPSKDLRIDPGLCLAAALGRDDDRTLNVCGALIDNAKTEKPDRIKALIARAAVYERKDMTTAPLPTMTACFASIPRLPTSITRAANSGARRATCPRR
jgi:hypothetical protein